MGDFQTPTKAVNPDLCNVLARIVSDQTDQADQFLPCNKLHHTRNNKWYRFLIRSFNSRFQIIPMHDTYKIHIQLTGISSTTPGVYFHQLQATQQCVLVLEQNYETAGCKWSVVSQTIFLQGMLSSTGLFQFLVDLGARMSKTHQVNYHGMAAMTCSPCNNAGPRKEKGASAVFDTFEMEPGTVDCEIAVLERFWMNGADSAWNVGGSIRLGASTWSWINAEIFVNIVEKRSLRLLYARLQLKPRSRRMTEIKWFSTKNVTNQTLGNI